MISLLALAFLIGMQHATEADHVAAVASITGKPNSLRQMLRLGAVWGLGHTVTLFILAGSALVLGWSIPDLIASMLEGAVGVLLVGLGAHVLYRLWQDRVHFHVHAHLDGRPHFHAHSHRGETSGLDLRHNWTPHGHEHRFSWRALFVGMMHGLAGSSALLMITVSQVKSVSLGLTYIAIFGLGSILGMALMSCVITIPLLQSAKKLTWLNHTLQGGLGVFTIVIGGNILRTVLS
jgi:high-affinity nickel permease